MNSNDEKSIVESALAQLFDEIGIQGMVEWSAPSEGYDLELKLDFADRHHRYHGIVKPRVDRVAAVNGLKVHAYAENTIVFTTYLSTDMATRCRDLGIQFIDTAGNAYLNNKQGLYIFVCGRKAPTLEFSSQIRSTTPSSIKVIFSLFANPNLLNAPLRQIAEASNVSLGLVGPIIKGLQARGFIGIDGAGKRAFDKKHQLVTEWATGYINLLRPKLTARRFAVPDLNALIASWHPQPGVNAWGGEQAAALLTNHLKPSTLTIYHDPDIQYFLGWLVQKFRLKADPAGQLEIVNTFWNREALKIGPIVPPELVYADLISSLDPRNIETAKLILYKIHHNA